MSKKVKDPNKLRFKDYFGTTLMGSTDALSSGVITGLFMLYLTDYAGIGKWGAILGTALLMFARIFDAVNDPIEGWIMDRAKVGKYGKYRPFLLLSVLFSMSGIIGLFALPSGIMKSPVFICVWVIFFYLLYDIGASFFAPNLMYRTMTLDPNERGKLLVGPRIFGMIIGVLSAAFISIINTINVNIGNMHKSFALVIGTFMVVSGVISAIGLLIIREKHHAERDEEDNVKITDIFGLIKENKALRIKLLDALFSGFIWTFLFATMAYYTKWAYCADLTTGAVDTSRFGLLTMISSMLMMFPLIIGTLVASPIMKKVGSPLKFHKILILIQALGCLALFVLEMVGLLRLSPIPFFLCAVVVATAIGADYIPGETLNIEVMDYEIYRAGKDRSALCNACNKFLSKAQSSVSTGLIGVILIAIGYEVDSVTDTYLGDLSAIPGMLKWFIVIMGLIPGIFGIISFFILGKYPVTDEIRNKMKSSDNK
ncbi:MFS transporter [Anaerobium acetethylicum]|uniref:Na+/melibiose symporter n=1 Tax=Anaerobium acetethylicum TaxID=1619234 RepID=A0A1D3TX44_9FIRM|nr:MFS transporter [Anaerobium acetethylicum]SCP98859.1 Na+/melibiose symporter [Anaerobium acetethylicum]